ncbi:MAG TPA: hypothetical protein VJ916_00610, partial [Anaerovoracaceae bacterium]|nr:hypothetical protein [Anaerovoracaceae bacterium]
MINRMRFKFITITGVSLIFLLLSILLTTNIVLTKNNENASLDILKDLARNDGIINIKPGENPIGPPKQMANNDTFSIRIDSQGNVLDILNDNSRVSDEYALELLDLALSNEDTDSYISLVETKSYGQIIVFADQGVQNQLL